MTSAWKYLEIARKKSNQNQWKSENIEENGVGK